MGTKSSYIFNAAPMRTAATSVLLAHLVTSGCQNTMTPVMNRIIARNRHRTSCHAKSDCEDWKNHRIVSIPYTKHQTSAGDFSTFDEVMRFIINGNDKTQKAMTQCFGSWRKSMPRSGCRY